MRVLIFGSRGYFGQGFMNAYPEAVAAAGIDIADVQAVALALDRAGPDVVINCAGKTGRPNIDWCETHKEETLRANVTGALTVLTECLKRNIYLVHIGSGCIYDGDNRGFGFSETDPPNYDGSFYSRTKAWVDQAMRELPVLLLRPRMPFDGSTSERNLIVKLCRYRRLLTCGNSMTHLPDFLLAASTLIERRATGVFNMVNDGTISPYEIMVRYRQLVNPEHRFEAADGDLGTVAGRSNCVLNVTKLAVAGARMPNVWTAVDRALLIYKFLSAPVGGPNPV